MNAHICKDEAIIFPVNFLSPIMTQDVNVTTREANELHPIFLASRMIIFPFCHNDKSSAFVLVNQGGITCSEMLDRSHPCMIILNSGSNIDPSRKSQIIRRIRTFLNMAWSMIDSGNTTRFSCWNYKAHEPDGA